MLRLLPRTLRRRGGVPPDAAVGDDAQELVAARPRDRPRPVVFGKLLHYGVCLVAHFSLSPMSVDKDVGIDRDHRAPEPP